MYFKTNGVNCIIAMYVKKCMYILKYQGISGHIATVRAWSHGSQLLVLRTSTFITFTRDYVSFGTSFYYITVRTPVT